MTARYRKGDRVRIVRLVQSYGMYDIGDEAIVTDVDGAGATTGFYAKFPGRADDYTAYLIDDEVVAADATDTPQDSRRKPGVGDRVVVVAAKSSGATYRNGDTGKIVAIDEDDGGYYVELDKPRKAVPHGFNMYMYPSEIEIATEPKAPDHKDTPMDKDTLRSQLTALRYNDLLAIAKMLKPNGLGFDANRKFQQMRAEKGGTMKDHFAAWILDNCPLGETVEALQGWREAQREGGVPSAPSAEPAGDRSKVAAQLADLLAKLGGKAHMDEAAVLAIVQPELEELEDRARKHAEKAVAEAALPRPVTITVKSPDGEKTQDMGVQHFQFESLLRWCAMKDSRGNRLNVWMTGPAGSGKTTAAENVAKALSLPFFFNGAIDTEYKLLGYTDAQGRVVSRPFREAYENGGLYLFDEIDASMPGAVLAFNAALANGHCDFPDKCVTRHPDCVIIAAANTFGAGANNEYVGRLKQDGAFLDRFVMLKWEYDEKLELALSGNEKWARKVQKVRKAVQSLGIRHVVSPRASLFGATMLANGEAEADVIDAVVRRGLSDEHWQQVRNKAQL